MRGRFSSFNGAEGLNRFEPRPSIANICVLLTGFAFAAIYSWTVEAQQTESAGPRPARAYQTVSPAITLQHISPVEYFRGLLGMTPAQRERALAGKPPAEKRAILEKVQQYKELPPEVREARLRQTELHWHLITLMRLDPAEREHQLKSISPLDQPMILAQLQQWDDLPEATRKALLEKESFIATYVAWQVSAPTDQREILNKLPEARRSYFAAQLKQWERLPQNERNELCAQFQRFFVTTGPAQMQTLSALSQTEREQMEQALRAYAALAPEQRQRCVDSFGTFVAMQPEERAQFLQNAEKWEAMTPHERQFWRILVGELPPMPPPPAGMPPMPPGLWQARFAPPVSAR
jgi:hypothetical protein